MRNLFGFSAPALASIVLILGAFILASLEVSNQNRNGKKMIVPAPMITMAQKQGPWPVCVERQLTGHECKEYIEGSDPSLEGHIVIIREGEHFKDDFQPYRVRIFVDRHGYVTQIPGRG